MSLKHWKIQLTLCLASLVIIPLSSYLFSFFFAQILIIPLLAGLLPLLLYPHFGILLAYPLGISLIYSGYLIAFSLWNGSLDTSLILLAFGSILIPTLLGYLLAILIQLVIPNKGFLLPINALAGLLIAITLLFSYGRADNVKTLSFYLIIPSILIVSQAIISIKEKHFWLSPFIIVSIFTLLYVYSYGIISEVLSIGYLLLSLGTSVIVNKISRKHH